ncbi:hypothetical protein [uncultured Duncaniella sp.]|uniref:hypothetical protein n=1 Tax=uncultured Duncaniella sp. TaxID=2768039 RepID=UPI0025B0FC00|nr:hypothetical protein [uncultured Duncaniella sp.]
MLFIHHFDAAITKACRTLLLCAAGFTLAGCTDDTFDQLQNKQDGPLAFEVLAPESWTDGSSRSRGVDDVAITRMDSGADGPLYLIAEISNNPDTVMSVSASRGTSVTTNTFYPSFGLSAICYAGSWSDDDASDLTTNFAHNIKMVAKNNVWQAADESEILDWTGSGNIRFFAYAPFDGDKLNANGASISHSAQSVPGIPAVAFKQTTVVKDHVDLLSTNIDCDASKGGKVSLKFRHSLTAVVVKTGDDMLPGKVTEVTLSGIYDRGTHSIGTDKWTIDEKTAVKETFTVKPDKTLDASGSGSKPGNTKPGEEIVGGDLTFFMVPQTLGSDAKLTIKFTDKASGADRTLTASLTGQTWKAGTRVAYSLNTTGIKVVPTVNFDFVTVRPTKSTREGETEIEKSRGIPTSGYIPEFLATAYAKVYQLNESKDEVNAKKVMLPFKVEYSKDGGATWKDASWTSHAKTDENGMTKGSILLEPRKVFSDMRGALYTNVQIGDSTSYHDLSGGGETANCYMVNAPGYYSLPLIYGNARGEGDVDNESAYTSKAEYVGPLSEKFVLKKFVDHNDAAISGPDIPGILIGDAVLLWQDSPELVRDVHLDADRKKINFQIDREAINQGNAVIAVRANGPDKTILWSWHIWVTHYDWNNNLILATSKGYEDNKEYWFTPCNLGYCDDHDEDKAAKTYSIRLTATLPDGTTKEYKVEGVEQDAVEASFAGDNTYYQWGRKDPMLSGIWNNDTHAHAIVSSEPTQFDMDNKPYYPGVCRFSKREHNDGMSIGESIRYTNQFFSHDNPGGDKPKPDDFWRRHWHNGSKLGGLRTIMNYWDSELTQVYVEKPGFFDKNYLCPPLGQRPTKTIYDPCPVGFCVPNANAFSNFAEKTYSTSLNYDTPGLFIKQRKGYGDKVIGWDISKIAESGNSTIFLPATGLRDMGEGSKALPEYFKSSTNPAHSKLTFIATTIFNRNDTSYDEENYYKKSSSCLLIYVDDRNSTIHINEPTNNAYGFSIRPIKDTK